MAYQQFGSGEGITIAGVTIGGKGPVKDIDNREDCNGESNGGWLVWRNGECKVTGGSGNVNEEKNTQNPNLKNATSSNEECIATGGGGLCEGTDTQGQSFKICVPRGTSKACYQHAIDAGYTMSIGAFNGTCVQSGDSWVLVGTDQVALVPYNNNPAYLVDGQTPLERANALCAAGKGTINFGTAKYICKEGVKGEGDVVYTGGACTALNGKPFTGNQLGCFCGTVQVDTGTGHTSYSSTCGCDKTPKESNPPTITTNPTMACTGLTQAPAAPKVGDKVTFTCTGTITPSTAGTLSYKFRYSINSAATVAMANKTATTAELSIAACGEYKVECQTCATIAGVLTCDPVWTGATQ